MSNPEPTAIKTDLDRHAFPARLLAAGALVGMATFPIAVVVLNVIQRDHYNPLIQPMSQLALSTDGWLMEVAFCTTGIGILLAALCLRRLVPMAVTAPLILAFTGLLYFVAAAFQTDPTGVPLSVHGTIHNMGGLAIFALQPIAIVIAGFSFRKRSAWRRFSRPTLIWGGLAIFGFFLLIGLGSVNLFGVGQRIGVGLSLAWLLTVSWRAFSSTGNQARPAHSVS